MSGALDVRKFLEAGTHLGGINLDFQMDQHSYKKKRVVPASEI